MSEQGVFFVGFCYSKLPVFRHLLKKGFGHVVLAAYCNKSLFLFEKRTYVSVMEAHSVENEEEAIKILLTISRLNVLASVQVQSHKSHWLPIGWLPHLGTCLSFIKLMLGVRLIGIWTPYQLYKYLKKSHQLGIIYQHVKSEENYVS